MAPPNDHDSMRGHLLVAAPSLMDPNFHRAVVFLLDHSEDGALGLVLNRPSQTPVREVLEAWGRLAADPGVVHVGGPVEPTAVIALGGIRNDALPEGWEPIIEGIRVVDLGADVALATTELTSIRVFAGYAGWGAGQLELELADESWFSLPARADDVLTADPERLWQHVLERAGADHRLMATMPDDPSMN